MIKGKFIHNNINVLDLEKSLAFYEKALGLTEAELLTGKKPTVTP